MTTYYWNPEVLFSAWEFNKAHNWSTGIDGKGDHPTGTKDDLFASLDTGIWTFRNDNGSLSGGTPSAVAGSGILTITSRGDDIWLGQDAYANIWRGDITGDYFSVEVHIQSQTNTNAWAKAGIMMLNDVTSPHTSPGRAFVAITPGNGAIMQWCGASNGYIDSNTVIAGTAPCYLKLVRRGTEVRGFYKKNATDAWTQIGAVSTYGLTNGTNSKIELFVTAHNSAADCAVVFDSFKAGNVNEPSATLSFNGTGASAHYDSYMSDHLTCAAIDFSGANNYNGYFNFNARQLTVTGDGAANFNQPAMTVDATGGGDLVATGSITFSAKLSLVYNGTTSWRIQNTGSSGTLTITGSALTLSANPNPPACSLPLLSFPAGTITGPFLSVTGMPTGFTLRYIGTMVELVQKNKASDFTPFF